MRTVTPTYAVEALRNAAAKARNEHTDAMIAGGYVNPYDGVGDVLPTDPIVIGRDTYANGLELASDLLELHERTGINITEWASARTHVEESLRGLGLYTPIVGDH